MIYQNNITLLPDPFFNCCSEQDNSCSNGAGWSNSGSNSVNRTTGGRRGRTTRTVGNEKEPVEEESEEDEEEVKEEG